VFPVRYDLDLCILLRRNSVFKGLNQSAMGFTITILIPLKVKDKDVPVLN
jgi:hypothetical protein